MRTVLNTILENRKALWTALSLLVVFFAIYLYLGSSLAATTAFSEDDLLFEMDTPRGINDLAVFSDGHYRTNVHPIYVLLVNPWGSMLNLILHSDVQAAVSLNAFLGALGVGLAFIFFYLYSRNLWNGLLLALVFGFSMSQILLSATPDTASLAIVSLLFTYILFLHSLQTEQWRFGWWVVAGIFSLGVTTTNFVQTTICFTLLTYLLFREEGKIVDAAKKIFRYGIWVIGITGVLAVVQKLIYPSSNLFFKPNMYSEDLAYTSFLILREPWRVISQLLKHFFMINYVAPFPDVYTLPEAQNPAVTFSTSWRYATVGWAALSIWLVFLTSGMVNSWRENSKMRYFFLAILACLLFNGLLHSIYGVGEKGKIEYFIYTGNFTFLALIFLSPWSSSKNFLLRLTLVTLIILLGFNNYLVFENILSIYR